jgi:hypothetical protein
MAAGLLVPAVPAARAAQPQAGTIAAGFSRSCAIENGSAWCWGNGPLGNGDITLAGSDVPVPVVTGLGAINTFTQISAGGYQVCALDTTGVAYCWGFSNVGELGTGSYNRALVAEPVVTSGVLAGKTLTQISAGSGAACVLDDAGAAYCWGWNAFGELGDGSTTMSDVPVLAGPQAPTGVTAIPGDMTAAVSWKAPGSLDGGTLIGYTASASPGGAACTTSGTTCTVTGLTDGTTYSITVVAHTTCGDSGASAPATFTPGGRPAFTSSPAVTAAYGHAFRFTVTATGDPAPRITRTGRLPSGVRFAEKSNGTATISGIPDHAAAGVYPLTLTARNKTGTATQAFTLTVTRAPAIRKIRATRARVGVALHLTIRATGYPVPVLAESGPLPGGLTFTDNGNGTASIAGTPAAGTAGSYPVAVTATNSSGSATRRVTMVVTQRR